MPNCELESFFCPLERQRTLLLDDDAEEVAVFSICLWTGPTINSRIWCAQQASIETPPCRENDLRTKGKAMHAKLRPGAT